MTVWVQKAGRQIWVKDWYEHTATILKFYEDNKDKAKAGKFSPEKYLTGMLNRRTKKIEIKDYTKEMYLDERGKLQFTNYYFDKGFEDIGLVCSFIDPIIEELKKISDYS